MIRGYRGGYLPLEAARDRARPARRLGAGRRLHQRPRAGHRHRQPRRGRAARLSRAASPPPGSRRAARAAGQGTSVAVLVANSTPLNQFIAKTPRLLLRRARRAGAHQPRQPADPGQPRQVRGLRAALHGRTRRFGGENLQEILGFLEEERLAAPRRRPLALDERELSRRRGEPAQRVLGQLRGAGHHAASRGSSPRWTSTRAPSTLHEKAVYILEGRTYFVEKYDHEERRAHVREAEVDYYTDAITYTKVKILDRFEEEAARARAPQPRRGPRDLAGGGLQEDQVPHQRERGLGRAADARERDAHHVVLADRARARCMAALPFAGEERRDGVVALSYTLGQLAALFLMCDRHDLGVALGDNGQGEAAHRARPAPAARARTDAPAPGRRLRAARSSSTTTTRAASASRSRSTACTTGCSRESRGADRRLPVPRRLPVLRGAGGGEWAAAARRSRCAILDVPARSSPPELSDFPSPETPAAGRPDVERLGEPLRRLRRPTRRPAARAGEAELRAAGARARRRHRRRAQPEGAAASAWWRAARAVVATRSRPRRPRPPPRRAAPGRRVENERGEFFLIEDDVHLETLHGDVPLTPLPRRSTRTRWPS